MSSLIYSGVEWLGPVPKGWNVLPLGTQFRLRKEKVSDEDYEPLSVTKTSEGIVPQMDTVAKSDEHNNRKLVLKNDFVINSRSDRKMSCGVSIYDGSVSLINLVLVPTGKLIPSYYHYLLKNAFFAEEFYRWGHGIVADLWTTGWDEMKKISILVPEKEIQIGVSNAIKQKEIQIDKLISNQEREVEKLKQYSETLIIETITKGLVANNNLKESGIEWIGQVPKHYKNYRLKDLLRTNFSGSWGDEEKGDENDRFCVRIADFDYFNQEVREELNTRRNYKPQEITQKKLIKGDIILEKSGGGDKTPVGRTVLFERQNDEEFMFANFSQCLRPKAETISSKYLAFYLKALYYSVDMKYYYFQTTGLQNLNMPFYLNTLLSIPELDEQLEICNFLSEHQNKINKLITIKQNKINKLNEFKKALVYEYVTGKKEVI